LTRDYKHTKKNRPYLMNNLLGAVPVIPPVHQNTLSWQFKYSILLFIFWMQSILSFLTRKS